MSEIEHHATELRTVQTAHLPGLFQTEEHARALFDLIYPPLPRLEVGLRVAHRLARQGVVTGAAAIPYVGLIHESALRMRIGGREVARAQLAQLLEASDRDNVTLRAVPFEAGGFPMIGESLLYARGENARLDTVHLDSPTGAVFVDSPTLLANYRRRLDIIAQVALRPEETRDLIRTISREL